MNPPHIAMVLPPEKNCGIVTYSNYLLHELEKLKGLHVETVVNHAHSDFGKYGELAHQLQNQFDVIHVQFEFARFGKLLVSGAGTPFFYNAFSPHARVITTLHDLPPKNQLIVQTLQRFFLSFVMSKSVTVIVHTDESAEQLRLLYPTHAHKIVVIPHGMLSHKSYSTKKNLPAALKGKKVIGAFGFPAPHKHFESIIEALAELPEDYVAVMGVGAQNPSHEAYLEQLKRYANERGVSNRIIWHGFVAEEKMAEVFSWMDVVVFPYTRVTESGALHLALAHRKAVVARDLPTFAEIAQKHQSVKLFSSPLELVKEIRLLAENVPERKRLIKNIDDIIAARNWKAVAEQHKQLYLELFLRGH